MTPRRIAIACVSLSAACSSGARPTAVADAPVALDLAALRESARATLAANCAECHTRGLATALPGALAVFDLTEADWSRRMTAAQLREARRRLDEPFGPALTGDTRPIHRTPAERARFAAFVDAEIARRR